MAEITNPVKAIKMKCLDCSGDSLDEVRQCPITSCALYPFRMGKNPYRNTEISPEQKAIRSTRMKALRQKQLEEKQKGR